MGSTIKIRPKPYRTGVRFQSSLETELRSLPRCARLGPDSPTRGPPPPPRLAPGVSASLRSLSVWWSLLRPSLSPSLPAGSLSPSGSPSQPLPCASRSASRPVSVRCPSPLRTPRAPPLSRTQAPAAAASPARPGARAPAARGAPRTPNSPHAPRFARLSPLLTRDPRRPVAEASPPTPAPEPPAARPCFFASAQRDGRPPLPGPPGEAGAGAGGGVAPLLPQILPGFSSGFQERSSQNPFRKAAAGFSSPPGAGGEGSSCQEGSGWERIRTGLCGAGPRPSALPFPS